MRGGRVSDFAFKITGQAMEKGGLLFRYLVWFSVVARLLVSKPQIFFRKLWKSLRDDIFASTNGDLPGTSFLKKF
jgi:hypothetical protein